MCWPWCLYYKTLTIIDNTAVLHGSALVTASHFILYKEPTLIAEHHKSHSALLKNDRQSFKVTDCDKRSSLQLFIIKYRRGKFYCTGPGR